MLQWEKGCMWVGCSDYNWQCCLKAHSTWSGIIEFIKENITDNRGADKRSEIDRVSSADDWDKAYVSDIGSDQFVLHTIIKFESDVF